jgi:beta-galactosidase
MFRPKLLPFAALLAAVFGAGGAAAASVYPTNEPAYMRSLNGDWSFKYVSGLAAGAEGGFTASQFDVSAWDKILVPANWELKGFAEPIYGDHLKDGLGLYRRTFRTPVEWQGRRAFLRFEGVAFGYEVWINGRKAGESTASAFNRHTFDVTDFLLPARNADNVLAVRVTTKPHGFEFDLNDDWSLSGIYRDVTLFSVAATYLQDYTASTRLVASGAAELSVAADLSQADGEVRAQLVGPDGRTVSDQALPRAGDRRRAAVIRVEQPKLWTAETPSLYRLRLTVSAGGKTLQTVEERIGLREVSIADGVLLLNGRPIKMRGVNHHDLEPKTGRAVTEAQMRQDLELMKKANVNYLRTSHYPPHPRLLELTDEMGFYVMDEVPIGHGEKNLDKPEYRANILARVEPTITRDKNRPSVLVWSIGNENPNSEAEFEAGRLAKKLDPSRPVTYPKIGSYFAANYERTPEFAEVYAPHYPSNSTLKGYAQKLKRPAILTEYAHALGLATDRIQAQWDIIHASPSFAGGSIWHFHDQGILRVSAGPVDTGKRTQLAWLDKHHYYDTNGLDGADGLVYADRTPQVDYWQMRKVYAPVQFAERTAAVKPGRQEIALTVENRYDFRSLAGMNLLWSLQRNGKEVQQGRVALATASRGQETVRIPVDVPAADPADVLALNVRAVDEQGLQVNERVLRLEGASKENGAAALADALAASMPPAQGEPVVTESAAEVKVVLPQWVLTLQRATGELVIRDAAGRVLVAGIHPHSGRKPTMAEALGSTKSGLWLSSTLTRLQDAAVKVQKGDGKVHIAVSGHYPLQDAAAMLAAAPQVATRATIADDLMQGAGVAKTARPGAASGEGLRGGYELEICANGVIAVSYQFAPFNAQGALSEAGLSVEAPAGMDEFRWIGQGPYAGYPGKDRLSEFGLHHLNREDLRFQGNRRGTEVALLTTAGGAGFAFSSAAADIAVERDGDRTLLSHNALIGGLGNKGTSSENTLSLNKTLNSAGAFTLAPVGAAWPSALTRWFGKPVAAKDVFKPFYHSYDQ